MDMSSRNDTAAGLLLGLAGVLVFSLTLPFTRLAVPELGAPLLTVGRAAVAGVAALLLLLAVRAPRPTRAQWRSLAVVSAGVVAGFPLFSTLALRTVPAAHGAVVIGLLPLGTALFAAWLGRERPSAAFWTCAVAGSTLVAVFALGDGAGLQAGDAWMAGAVVAGALGYAEGGRLARELGGTRVICWALVLALPLSLPAAAWLLWQGLPTASAAAWSGFAYVCLMSQFTGFFFWYAGLARGGVARVGQLQLVQPFLSVMAAAWLLAEPLDARTLGFALAVVATVALGRRMPVRRAPS